MKKGVTKRPTLDSVESMLERYIALVHGNSDIEVFKALELLVKLHLDLLLATGGLGPKMQERARFLLLRMEVLERYITIQRQVGLYRQLTER